MYEVRYGAACAVQRVVYDVQCGEVWCGVVRISAAWCGRTCAVWRVMCRGMVCSLRCLRCGVHYVLKI